MIPGIQSKLSTQVVASTTTISNVFCDMVMFTGTTAIATINPPGTGGFNAMLICVPLDGSVAFTTAGNIAVAVTMAIGRATLLAWDQVTAKWYPGAIS